MAGIRSYNLGGADIHNPIEARRPASRPWQLGAGNLQIVSFGTGSFDHKVTASGTMAWDANALQGMVTDGQELALTMLQWMSEPKKAWPVDRVIGDPSRDLLGRNEGLPQALLSFHRYDVLLEDKWLLEHHPAHASWHL